MKRANLDSVESSSIAVDEIANVSNQITNMCKTLSSLSTDLGASITSAINNLTFVLSQKLDRITDILEAKTANCSVPEAMQVDNKTSASGTEAQGSLSNVKEELKDLKNMRYQSLQRIAYNSNHAELYRLSVLAEPKLVPKKKHEHIASHDPEGLREVKIKKNLFNVDCEIEELLFHKNIQEDKVKRIDAKAKSILENIPSIATRSKIEEDWKTITQKGEESITKMWEKKREFLQSTAHMIKLGTVTPSKEKGSFKSNESQSYKQALLQRRNVQSSNIGQKPASNQVVWHRRDNINSNFGAIRSQMPTNYQKCTTDNSGENVDIDSADYSNNFNNNDWTMVSHSKNGRGWQTKGRMKN